MRRVDVSLHALHYEIFIFFIFPRQRPVEVMSRFFFFMFLAFKELLRKNCCGERVCASFFASPHSSHLDIHLQSFVAPHAQYGSSISSIPLAMAPAQPYNYTRLLCRQ